LSKLNSDEKALSSLNQDTRAKLSHIVLDGMKDEATISLSGDDDLRFVLFLIKLQVNRM